MPLPAVSAAVVAYSIVLCIAFYVVEYVMCIGYIYAKQMTQHCITCAYFLLALTSCYS